MPTLDLPQGLTVAAWDKQSKALKKTKPVTEIGDALKALVKAHLAFDPGPIDAAKAAADTDAERRPQAAHEAKKLRALLDDARTLEAQARKLEAELKKDKQPPDAATALAKAAGVYAADVTKADAAAQAVLADLDKRIAAAKTAPKAAPKVAAAPDPLLDKLAERIRNRTLAAFKMLTTPDAVPIPFMLAVAPKRCLLSMGPSVAASERNQLAKLVPDDGMKCHAGICTFDRKTQVFVFTGATLPTGAGLGARLQKSLVGQIGKKLRVRLMRPDGQSEDGEPLAAVDGFDDVDAALLRDDEDAPVAPPQRTDAALAPAVARLAALQAQVRASGVLATPSGAQVQARLDAAERALREGKLDVALKLLGELDAVAKLLKGKQAAAPRGAKVLFAQSRLRWDGARKQVQVELRKLEEQILAAARGQSDFDDIATCARGVYRILDRLDESLIDRLDEAYAAADAAAEARAHEAARKVVVDYRNFVDTDPLMLAIDDNPFGKVDVRASVVAALTELQARLAANAV